MVSVNLMMKELLWFVLIVFYTCIASCCLVSAGLTTDYETTLSLDRKSVFRDQITTMLALEKYEFEIDSYIDVDDKDLSFKVEFILLNRSGVDIEFDLIAHCGEDKPVQFILRNNEDEILWQYIFVNPLTGCPDLLEEFTLSNNKVLRRVIDVPLVIEGVVLEDGEYTLEAAVDGTPKYNATAPFKIK